MGDILTAIKKRAANLPPYAKGRIKNLLVGRTQSAFPDQGRPPMTWPARKVPNKPGIVADANAGENIKARRLQARPAAIDTGSLMRSIDGVWKGNMLEYGAGVNGPQMNAVAVQNGVVDGWKPLTETGAKRIGTWLSKRGTMVKRLESTLKQILRDRGAKSGQSPRPYVMLTQEDRTAVGKIMIESILRG